MDKTENTREYTNGEITIAWKPTKCVHSGNCARGLAAVFRPREKPWIKPGAATTEAIKTAIANCPSGALSWH